MFGTAYFYDGHTEPIISYQFNPSQTELYFKTKSGTYGYKEDVQSEVYDVALTKQLFKVKLHNFFKYNREWLAYPHIERIEIYTEVLPDD